MKLRAASRSSSFSNATSRSGADPNMCRNDHSAKHLPRSFSSSAKVSFAPQFRSLKRRSWLRESGHRFSSLGVAGILDDPRLQLHSREKGSRAVTSAIILAMALPPIALAHRDMGQPWRIGIDNLMRTPLVPSGLFRISRNPIFLGMRLSLWGLLLAMPSGITAALALFSEALIGFQVRLEEENLRQTYGLAYVDYTVRTRRWI